MCVVVMSVAIVTALVAPHEMDNRWQDHGGGPGGVGSKLIAKLYSWEGCPLSFSFQQFNENARDVPKQKGILQ